MKYTTKPPVFYHGTDARFVRMRQEEREKLREDALYASNYMLPFYLPHIESRQSINAFNKELQDEDLAHNSLLAAQVFDRYLRTTNNDEPGQYQYGDLYLTSDIDNALTYAYSSFIGGEFNRLAYRMFCGARSYHFEGWKPTERFNAIMQKLCRFAEEEPEPVVLKFAHLDWNYILQDTGEPLFPEDIEEPYFLIGRSIRYTRHLEFDLSKAWFLPKDPQSIYREKARLILDELASQ